MSSYDSVAWFYDRLSRLVYGKALVEAQIYLLKEIPPAAKVLIVGGGTGWILEELGSLRPSGLEITYVDASIKMLERARTKSAGQNKVTFIHAYAETLNADISYDVVMTPFLFDNLTDDLAKKAFGALDRVLGPGGIWLYCDYRANGNAWQRFMLWSMYRFFRLMGSVAAKTMPDMDALFARSNYVATGQKTFFRGFVCSVVYRKKL